MKPWWALLSLVACASAVVAAEKPKETVPLFEGKLGRPTSKPGGLATVNLSGGR